MNKTRKLRRRTVFLIVWLAVIAALLAAILLLGLPGAEEESIREVMRDGVLHELHKVALFGVEVNPALVSAYVVTVLLLLMALVIRFLLLPRFQTVPGPVQSVIEWVAEFFSGMAGKNSPHKTGPVSAYIFGVGLYIFFGTLFELLGLQVITTTGESVSLPAPVSDINGAIAVGVTSYLVILLGGLVVNGGRGVLGVLKDFSLPISMSFRLFGALLSGLLVTELVYYYVSLSFVLPVVVGILFTLLHALIQTYVLTTLVSIFYGEAVEPRQAKAGKTAKRKKGAASEDAAAVLPEEASGKQQ